MGSEADPGLAHALAKVAAWQAVVDSYRTALALEQSVEPEGSGVRSSSAGIELPVGVFRGMNIPEAVKLFLQSKRRKQTAPEIAAGLLAGGMETTSKTFTDTVTSALHRMKDKDVLRFPDGWDLAEAHSTALRNRLANTATPKKAKKPNGATKKSRTTKPAKANGKKTTAKSTAQKGPKGPSLDDRIQAFLGAKPMEWFTSKHVAEALNETNAKNVALAFARLVRYGRVARQDDGRYAAVRK